MEQDKITQEQAQATTDKKIDNCVKVDKKALELSIKIKDKALTSNELVEK